MTHSQKNRRDPVLEGQLRPGMTFNAASKIWLDAMQFDPNGTTGLGFVRPRTHKQYRACIRALERQFGDTLLRHITPADLRKYQERRASGELTPPETKRCRHQRGPGAGAANINTELRILIRILRRAKAWTAEIAEGIAPLRHDPVDVPRAMTPAEQKHFLKVAASKPQWETIYWYSVMALKTTMSTNEMRALRIRDIDLAQGVVLVRGAGAKNNYRIRSIPLDQDGTRAAEYLLSRAQQKGSVRPEQFLFPFRINRATFDPNRPMGDSGLRTRWCQVRAAAGLDWLRQYDLRHTGITRYAEAGTPIAVLMAMAGHCNPVMTAHYTHISIQAKRKAMGELSALNHKQPAGKEGQNREVSLPQLIHSLQAMGLPAEKILEIISFREQNPEAVA